MQIVKTDSVKPQNKVGLPIGVSDLMFLNISHLSKKGEDEMEIKVNSLCRKNKNSSEKQNNLNMKKGEINVSVAQRGYSMVANAWCSRLPGLALKT